MEDPPHDICIEDGELRRDSDEEHPQHDADEQETAPEPDSQLWRETFVPTTIPPFEGPPRGPKKIPEDPKNPLAWFELLFPPSLVEHITAQTNLYIAQFKAATLSKPSRAKHLAEVTQSEIKKVLGIAILQGLRPSPQISMNWDEDPLYHNPYTASALSLNRFENILRFLHLANNDRVPANDKIYKIREYLQRLEQNYREAWNMGREVSIDEMDLAFKGRHEGKERIIYKRAGDGFLVYALCDTNGFVYSFTVKFDNQRRNEQSLSSVFSALYTLACRLPSSNKWHHVFADNLYSNVRLAECLFQKKILFTCTARENRVPPICSIAAASDHNTFKAVKKNGVIAVGWKDRKVVRFITTGHSSASIINTQRTRKRFDETTQEYCSVIVAEPTLNIARDYNDNMNGVDVADQLRIYYPVRLKSRKWWHVFFWWGVQTSICNAYLMYKTHFHGQHHLDHKGFRKALALQLLGIEIDTMGEEAMTKASKRRRSMTVKPTVALAHMPVKVPTGANGRLQDRECVRCKRLHRNRHRTSIVCSTCEVGLCLECYAPFHSEINTSA
jgi:hypothetical protein